MRVLDVLRMFGWVILIICLFRLWKLIDLAENLVNFSVSSFKRGYDLSSVANSLVRLGVGRETILR